jgi:hypothetical protein
MTDEKSGDHSVLMGILGIILLVALFGRKEEKKDEDNKSSTPK